VKFSRAVTQRRSTTNDNIATTTTTVVAAADRVASFTANIASINALQYSTRADASY